MPYFELSKDDFSFPPAYFAANDGLVAVASDLDYYVTLNLVNVITNFPSVIII